MARTQQSASRSTGAPAPEKPLAVATRGLNFKLPALPSLGLRKRRRVEEEDPDELSSEDDVEMGEILEQVSTVYAFPVACRVTE